MIGLLKTLCQAFEHYDVPKHFIPECDFDRSAQLQIAFIRQFVFALCYKLFSFAV